VPRRAGGCCAGRPPVAAWLDDYLRRRANATSVVALAPLCNGSSAQPSRSRRYYSSAGRAGTPIRCRENPSRVLRESRSSESTASSPIFRGLPPLAVAVRSTALDLIAFSLARSIESRTSKIIQGLEDAMEQGRGMRSALRSACSVNRSAEDRVRLREIYSKFDSLAV